MTCWRRLRDWQQEGIWDLMHFALLNWLARNGDIHWSRAIVEQLFRACGVWRDADWSEPDRPRQVREQAACRL
jgi:hypothetical protein